jgi:hypothetical protein
MIGLFPGFASAQWREPLTLNPDGPQPRDATPPPGSLATAGAVVATGVNIPLQTGVCGIGDVLGFFVGVVARLPVWALSLGDRVGTSEPLDRFGATVVENACDNPRLIAPEQVRRAADSLPR